MLWIAARLTAKLSFRAVNSGAQQLLVAVTERGTPCSLIGYLDVPLICSPYRVTVLELGGRRLQV